MVSFGAVPVKPPLSHGREGQLRVVALAALATDPKPLRWTNRDPTEPEEPTMKEPMSGQSTAGTLLCPRCRAAQMTEVTSIAPLLHEPGLIAYECPRCLPWPWDLNQVTSATIAYTGKLIVCTSIALVPSPRASGCLLNAMLSLRRTALSSPRCDPDPYLRGSPRKVSGTKILRKSKEAQLGKRVAPTRSDRHRSFLISFSRIPVPWEQIKSKSCGSSFFLRRNQFGFLFWATPGATK